MHGFEVQRLAMQFRRRDLPIALKFPRENSGEVFVVAHCFALRRLMFFAEMSAAGFVPRERVGAHQLGELQEIGHTSGAFERLIKFFAAAGNFADVSPKSSRNCGIFTQRFAPNRGCVRAITTFVPKKRPELAVKGIERSDFPPSFTRFSDVFHAYTSSSRLS